MKFILEIQIKFDNGLRKQFHFIVKNLKELPKLIANLMDLTNNEIDYILITKEIGE